MSRVVNYCPICGMNDLKYRRDVEPNIILASHNYFYCYKCRFGFEVEPNSEFESKGDEKFDRDGNEYTEDKTETKENR